MKEKHFKKSIASHNKKKIYVLETSVTLYSHDSIMNFEENDIGIPITVLEELDQMKKGNDTLNFEAREFIRMIDKLSIDKMLNDWIPLNGKTKGKFKILHDINPKRIEFIKEKLVKHFNITKDDIKPLNKLNIPKDSIVAMINHHGKIGVAHGNSQLTEEDIALVFASPDDLTHDWKATSTDLKWIADIPGIKWFEYEKGVKVNGKQCKQRWDGQKLKNGHWIVFSKCSWPHQKLVLEFIRESLVNDKIITVDSKISRK